MKTSNHRAYMIRYGPNDYTVCIWDTYANSYIEYSGISYWQARSWVKQSNSKEGE